MIDIRKRIKKLMDEYSHDLAYIRRDTRFRCTCYSERSGEASANCEQCFGTSYVVSIEKRRARRQIASVPESLIGVNKLQSAGRLSPTAYVYYFEHDLKPTVDDIILEVIWDKSGVPRHIKEKHLISAVVPQQGVKGRIEFYQVYARYDQKGAQDETALSEY